MRDTKVLGVNVNPPKGWIPIQYSADSDDWDYTDVLEAAVRNGGHVYLYSASGVPVTANFKRALTFPSNTRFEIGAGVSLIPTAAVTTPCLTSTSTSNVRLTGDGAIVCTSATVPSFTSVDGLEVSVRIEDSSGNSLHYLLDGSFPVTEYAEDSFVQSESPDFLSPAIYYRFNEGAGSTISDSLGNGPDISVSGTLTHVWDNQNWFTCHSSGHTMQVTGNTYINNLFRMVGFSGSIYVAFDYYFASVPGSATEVFFGIWRPANAGGGFRIAKASGQTQVGMFWTEPGQSEASFFIPLDAAETRYSLVVQLDFSRVATQGRLACTCYRNGESVRANDFSAATVPAVESSGGLTIGSYYNGSLLSKLGGGGAGARIARFFAMRQNKSDARAGYLLSDWWSQSDQPYDLPQSLRSV